MMFLALAGCSHQVNPEAFGLQGRPDFDPVAFFDGHVLSYGVLENRSGQPTAIVRTDCRGSLADNRLEMHQTLSITDQPDMVRDWKMWRTPDGHYAATANDMQDVATGEVKGNAFHWRWTLMLPNTVVGSVVMDQWWYAVDPQTMLNRTTIRKFGFVVAEVSEVFQRAPS
jgi:hypothetical protein